MSGRLRDLPRRWILLAVILLAALGLRVFHLDAKSFWFDEFQTAELAGGRGEAHYDLPDDVVIEHPPNLFDLRTAAPIRNVWFGDSRGHAPPLYALLVRLWGEVFGLGETSLRSLSLLASLAAIAAFYAVMRELSGTSAALWAVLLMALAGPQIEYAQEARDYTLLLLEALLAAAALVRIQKRGPSAGRCVTLSAALLAMTLTHYFSAGVILALAIYAGVSLRERSRAVVIGCFAAAALGWLVLGAPLALHQMHNVNDPYGTDFLNDASPGHMTRTALRIALLPLRFFTEPMGNVIAPAAVGCIAFPLVLLLAIRRRELLLWALWLWLTILPIAALDLARKTQHLEFIRYTLLASPALYALVAAALSDRPGRVRHLPPLLAAIACALALQAAYSTWWKADWRSLAHEVDAAAHAGDITVFWRGNGYPAHPNSAFLHTSYYRRDPYGPIVLVTHAPDETLLRRLRESPGVLLISLQRDIAVDALAGATLTWKGYEPGAGVIYRVTWPMTTTPPTTPPATTAIGASR